MRAVNRLISWMGGRLFCRALASLVIVIGLTGCPPVRFAEDYDRTIDQGLTTYYEAVSQFLSRMEQLARANDAAAQYENRDNKSWYAEQSAKLDALILRAKAQDEKGACIGSDLTGKGISLFLSKLTTTLVPLAKDVPGGDDLINQLNALQSSDGLTDAGSCTVVVLTGVKANHLLIELIHEKEKRLQPVVIRIMKPLVEQGVRIALKNELAKKR